MRDEAPPAYANGGVTGVGMTYPQIARICQIEGPWWLVSTLQGLPMPHL